MTQVATINPLNQYFDQPSGLPLTDGKIYIGEVNKDPEQFPITVYWDSAGLVPAVQPIRTTSGYPTRNGSPAILYVNSLYSMRVRNRGDVQVFYIASAGTTPPVTPTPFVDTELTPSYVSANSFTLTGDQTAEFQPGRRARMTLGSGFVYGTISTAVYGALTTVTMVMDSTSLDASLSAVALSFFPVTPNALPAIFGYSTYACDGRLTLTTGVPVTTSDVTAATTLYFTPYRGNKIATYNGTGWTLNSFTEKSIAVPNTASTMYDVFIVDGTLALEVLAWTNITTRATALVLQDGVLVKSGQKTRRYLGSFATGSVAGQVADSEANRNVYNYCNQMDRIQSVVDTTDNWSYTTATWREARGVTTNRFTTVIGVADTLMEIDVHGSFTNAGGSGAVGVGVGVNSTTVNSAKTFGGNQQLSNAGANIDAKYRGYPAVGLNTFSWLEISFAGGVTTFYGDSGTTLMQTGMMGKFKG